MNRFWGRGSDGTAAPRFSRDSEQLLALNYENLCDAEYLNRLFVHDNSAGSPAADKESGGGDTSTSNYFSDASSYSDSIYSSDLAEDLVIFGDTSDIGRVVFERRFHTELSSQNFARNNQDSVTSLISRQAVVFEHIGKLMLERCTAPLPKRKSTAGVSGIASTTTTATVEDRDSGKSNDTSEGALLNHIATDALASTLRSLERKNLSSLSRPALESLLSIILQILKGTNGKLLLLQNPSGEPQLPMYTSTFKWNAQHIRSLRNIFFGGLTTVLVALPSSHDINVLEERLKHCFTCFYGLLTIGLSTRSPSELLLAIFQLMTILIRIDDFQGRLVKEVKDLKAQLLAMVGAYI